MVVFMHLVAFLKFDSKIEKKEFKVEQKLFFRDRFILKYLAVYRLRCMSGTITKLTLTICPKLGTICKVTRFFQHNLRTNDRSVLKFNGHLRTELNVFTQKH